MTPRGKKAKPWKLSVGEAPHTVYVFERYAGSMLYIQAWNPTTKRRPKRSLGHKDREKATEAAWELYRRLAEGTPARGAPATVGTVLAAYLKHRTPKKTSANSRAEDERRAGMWRRVLGAQKRVGTLGREEWEDFIARRIAGAIDAHGRPIIYVGDGPRKPVSPRTADADLVFLVAVFNWALSWRGADGRKLLSENPWGAAAPGVKRALERPKNLAVERPVATYDRYLRIRAAAPRVLMEARKGDDGAELVEVGRAAYRLGEGAVMKWMRPSYLLELLDLVEQTGRRITAVCRLWYSDVVRERGTIVAIRWRSLKGGRETVIAVSSATRATLERIFVARPGFGDQPMFPSRKTGKAIEKRLATDWLHEAERIADVPRLRRGAFHPFRRKWASERKHLPTADVMEVGGWEDERSLKTSYQLPDSETVLEVVNEPRKLRERKPS